MPSQPTSWRSIIILSYRLFLGLPSGHFSSGLALESPYASVLSHMRYTCYMHRPSHSVWYYRRNNVWWANYFTGPYAQSPVMYPLCHRTKLHTLAQFRHSCRSQTEAQRTSLSRHVTTANVFSTTLQYPTTSVTTIAPGCHVEVFVNT